MNNKFVINTFFLENIEKNVKEQFSFLLYLVVIVFIVADIVSDY